MNTNHTLIVMLLDGSGSMNHLVTGAITGINGLIAEQRKLTEDLGERKITLAEDLSSPVSPLSCNLTMIRFTGSGTSFFGSVNSNGEPKDYFHEHTVIHNNIAIQDIPEFTATQYPTHGGTPLIDAFCKCIDDTQKQIDALPDNARPGRVMFVVMTDGMENASTKFKKAELTERLKTFQDTHNWQFIYLGANQDAIAEANLTGYSAGQSISYAATPQGLDMAFASTSSVLSAKRSAPAMMMRCMSYSEDAYTKQDSLLGSNMNAKHIDSTSGALTGAIAANTNAALTQEEQAKLIAKLPK